MKIYQVGQGRGFYSPFKIVEYKNGIGYDLSNYRWYTSKYMEL